MVATPLLAVRKRPTQDAKPLCIGNGKVYSGFDFVKPNRLDYEHNLGVTEASAFGDGEIVAIGGTYLNRYAIVRS
jgi:hypothetical protein